MANSYTSSNMYGGGGQEPPATPNSLAKDLAAEFKRFHGAEVLTVADSDGTAAPVLVVPDGKTVVPLKPILDAFREVPERRKGTATLQDPESFIAHVNRFKDADSVIFAVRDRAKPHLTAIYDYNVGGAIGAAPARWGTHRAVYAPPVSDEWKAWRDGQGTPMSMAQFAEFLGVRIVDVIPHDPADAALTQWAELVGGRFATPGQLLGLSRNMEVNVESVVKNAQVLDTGELAIVYEETHKDGTGAPVRVPNLFLVAIPVFYGDARYPIPVRLRYRVAGGKIAWTYTLHQPEKCFDHAFAELAAKVEAATELPLFVGAPETATAA